MTGRQQYTPGPANVAQVRKDGEKWTLVLVRELRHSPEKVWGALTHPAQLREWAPFDADRSLGTAGTTVKLTTVGAPTPRVSETTVTRADAPNALEYNWGGFDMRWELEALGRGTRLTLWTNIDRRFISMGAAGWHISLDVLDRLLAGQPIGRIVGPEAMKFDGWRRLNAEYAKQFGIEKRPTPSPTPRSLEARGRTAANNPKPGDIPMSTDTARTGSGARWMLWTGWLFSFAVVAQMLSSAWFRATQHTFAVAEIVTAYGYPESAIGRIVIAECALVVLYLVPQTSVLAAILMTGYLGGAVATHLRIGDTARAAIPLVVGILAWGGLYLRDSRIRQLVPFRRSV